MSMYVNYFNNRSCTCSIIPLAAHRWNNRKQWEMQILSKCKLKHVVDTIKHLYSSSKGNNGLARVKMDSNHSAMNYKILCNFFCLNYFYATANLWHLKISTKNRLYPQQINVIGNPECYKTSWNHIKHPKRQIFGKERESNFVLTENLQKNKGKSFRRQKEANNRLIDNDQMTWG